MHGILHTYEKKQKKTNKPVLNIKQISLSKGVKLHVYVCACDNIFITLVEQLAVAVDSSPLARAQTRT